MDPLTLFALANGAVQAVKKGCELYKEIKSAAGDVKDVLKDLDDQFHNKFKDRAPTVAERNQYITEKNRIIDLNKKGGETASIYTEIGEQLGAYFDNYYKCKAIFDEEERRAKTEVYTGDASLGKRALQRILMRKQLEQMGLELRELMVYQSPPELGALYTEVEAMMKQMGAEQATLIARQMRDDAIKQRKRKNLMDRYFIEGAAAMIAILALAAFIMAMSYVVQDRIEKYPHLGTDWIPKTEAQRQREAIPPVWKGR